MEDIDERRAMKGLSRYTNSFGCAVVNACMIRYSTARYLDGYNEESM